MNTSLPRRTFLKQAAASGAALAAPGILCRILGEEKPSEKVILGVMGVNGRGTDLARGFTLVGGAHVAYVCDVDERALARATRAVVQEGTAKPNAVRDFRALLDDRGVDALVIAAPDHWHAPATILACAASKHVYVETPASHNGRESELMVATARRHGRIVQLGTQMRSMPGVVEAIGKVKGGTIGRVLFSRCWYNQQLPSIGRGKPAAVPSWLDWRLWQGPAPAREFRDNVVHHNWRWFWHWGTGELGNNGIHALDVCRWGLGADYPTRVSAGGGKYHHDDDQETPDTHLVTFDFGAKRITWEGRNWHRRGFEGSMFGVAFHGDQGTIVMDGSSYKLYDRADKEVEKGSGSRNDAPHLRNFLDSIRGRAKPAAAIEEGHKSTLLCHLGNIAYRVGRKLSIEAGTGHIIGDPDAERLLGREYRSGWVPEV
jgi:predicted dehydrogenase